MDVIVKTAPGTLPMAVSTAMRHVRSLEDDVDLLELYCRAAVQAVEEYTGRAMANTVYTAQLGAWPCFVRAGLLGISSPPQRARRLDCIELPRSPLVSIGSLKYYPEDGGAQVTWDAANYRANTRSLPGQLVFIDGYTLPSLAARHDAIEIEFTAGTGVRESEMNPSMLTAVLQLARHFFDNPGTVDMDGNVRRMPMSFQALVRSQKISL